jgi:hypothetical protein
MITEAENEFRQTMILYGVAFLPGTPEEIVLSLSQQMAELGKAYLASIGITELPIPDDQLIGLVVYFMEEAIGLIQGDYMAEVEATIDQVRSQLWARWIWYW